MHPIVVQGMVQDRLDTFKREAAGDLRLALAPPAAIRPSAGLRERLNRATARLRLIVRVARV